MGEPQAQAGAPAGAGGPAQATEQAGRSAAALDRIGDRIDPVSAGLAEAAARVDRAKDACLSRWQGPAALAAAEALTRDRAPLGAARDELLAVALVLRQAAAEMRQAPPEALAALDESWAARLAALAGQARGTPREGPARAALAAGLPPATAPPARVRAWWQRLPPSERAVLVRTRPELVGNLDGVPAVVRDRANRAQLAAWLAAPPQGVRGARELAHRLRREAGRRPPVLLLALSAEGGQGHAALAYGDPDTAERIGVYVPGVGSSLATLATGDADRTRRLWQAARAAEAGRGGAGRRAGVAAVVWLGHSPPPGPGSRPEAVQAALPDRARAGAVPLARFLAGLRTGEHRQGVRLTAIGHSYGSLTVAQASRRASALRLRPPDRLVLIGSPGTGVQHAAELGVPPDQVWVGQAAHDPVANVSSPVRHLAVPLLGPAAGLLDHLLGRHGPQGWFGADPASPGFGARRLRVGPGRAGFSSHSAYFDAGSSSLHDMARVLAAR